MSRAASRHTSHRFIWLASAVGCAPSGPVVDSVSPPKGTPSEVAEVTPSASTSAPASASASAAPAASAPVPDPGDRPSRVRGDGPTRGKIACGETSCAAPRESCGFDENALAWTCELATEETSGPYTCDDGTDCPNGETCCHLWDGSWQEHAVCVARKDVAQMCQYEMCVRADDGAKCPAGQSCDGLKCEAPDGPATCTGKTRCPRTAPFCVQTAQRGYECAAAGTTAYNGAGGHNRYACTRQSDCGSGESCFAVVGDSEPETATACGTWSGAFMGPLVCEVGSGACPRAGNCEKRMSCNAYEDKALPWLGAWAAKMN